MKKQLLALAVGLVLLSGSAYAWESEALVSLDQRGVSAGRFFIPLPSFLGGDSDLILSHTSYIPFENDQTANSNKNEVGSNANN